MGKVVPFPPAEAVASVGVMQQSGRAGSEGEEEEEDATEGGMHFLEEEGTCQKSRKSDAGTPCKNSCLVNKMKQVGGIEHIICFEFYCSVGI